MMNQIVKFLNFKSLICKTTQNHMKLKLYKLKHRKNTGSTHNDNGKCKVLVKEVHMLNFGKYTNPKKNHFFLDIP
jgi:hypothetical protein